MKIHATITLTACLIASNAFAMDGLDSMNDSIDKLENKAQELIDSSEKMMHESSEMVKETVEEAQEDIEEQMDDMTQAKVECPTEVNGAVFDGLAAPGHILAEIYSLQLEIDQKIQADPAFKESDEYRDQMNLIARIKEMMKPLKLSLNCESPLCERDEAIEFEYSFDLALFPNCQNYTYNVALTLDNKTMTSVQMVAHDGSQSDPACEADNAKMSFDLSDDERKACVMEWGETIYRIYDSVK